MAKDRYEQARDRAAADTEYRRAYYELLERDPTAAKELPDPNAPPAEYDPIASLERIRSVAGGPPAKFEDVPSVSVRT